MSKISIKKDFADGNILPASDLNNNFRVIEAGINANEENLETVIEQAIVRLDAELEAITADRGWDWNGGDRVTFFKGTTAQVATQDVINGQLLYNTDTGETALDDDGERITTGSGNVVVIDDNEPENPATKLWIEELEPLNDIGTEVVNSMSGNETAMAPSVHSVKEYVKDVYSTSEVKTNKVWTDGKPIYRTVFNLGDGVVSGTTQQLNISNISEITSFTCSGLRVGASHQYLIDSTNYVESGGASFVSTLIDSSYISIMASNHTFNKIKYVVEYTKTTD